MQVKMYPNFKSVIEKIQSAMRTMSVAVRTEKWQGIDISKKPEMATYELLNVSFSVPTTTADLKMYRADVEPNLPWADDHFEERVCGVPINPGTEWANWPGGKSASSFLVDGMFNHNYMERYWGKHAAGFTATKTPSEWNNLVKLWGVKTHKGLRHDYGDLKSVVKLLVEQPFTRQAYLPIWFPEDTGVEHGGRVPCTLGYHFIRRGNFVHINYYLRSCDFTHHFRDDIYLTLRLLFWVIEQCKEQDPENWDDVRPGIFTMHVTSMHIFKNEYQRIFKEPHKGFLV
jgi:hypothetical protein